MVNLNKPISLLRIGCYSQDRRACHPETPNCSSERRGAIQAKIAALAIAYIGGGWARRALTNALPGETDPCVKNFLRVSLKAFDNKPKPNHISSAQNGKWLSALYCL
jgi:hypothetical protein